MIPFEAGAAIVLWIGIIITAQAFQTTPLKHAPAIGFGLFPAVAAYGISVMERTMGVVGSSLETIGIDRFTKSSFYISGMIALERGFILTSMNLAAIVVYAIKKNFIKAALWACVASALSFFGIIHSFEITGRGIVSVLGINTAPYFSVGYLLMGAAFYLTGRLRKT